MRRVYDRLILIEGSIDEYWNTGDFTKPSQQFPEARVRFTLHGLQAASSIRVRYGRDSAALIGLDVVRLDHERRGLAGREVIAGGLREDRRAERAKCFAMLNAAVQNIFHLYAARVGQDAAVAERARSKLHASLKPARDFSSSQCVGGLVNERVFIEPIVNRTGTVEFIADLAVAIFGSEIDVAHNKRAGMP